MTYNVRPPPPSSSIPTIYRSVYLLSLLQGGLTCLHTGAFYGHLEAVRTLLAAGASPTAVTEVRRGREDFCREKPLGFGSVLGRYYINR